MMAVRMAAAGPRAIQRVHTGPCGSGRADLLPEDPGWAGGAWGGLKTGLQVHCAALCGWAGEGGFLLCDFLELRM